MCEEQIIKLIFDGTRTLAIVVVSIVGIYGINSWRRETRWKRKYELAEEVLALVYEAKECIEMIRQDFSWGYEGRTRKKGEHETPEETDIRNTAYVTVERSNRVNETFNKLQSLKFRFAAVFNQPNTSLFDELIKTRNTLVSSAYRLADARVRKSKETSTSKKDFERIEKFKKIIWSDYEKEDEISKKVNQTIKEIEDVCRIVIKKSA